LKIERKIFERAAIQIVRSTNIRELIREFSPCGYRIFFYSLLKDISEGRDSPNYYLLKKVARNEKIDEQFIVERAKYVLSYLAPNAPKEDYYKILNVSRLASADEIRSSWLNLMKIYHPDKMGDRGLNITKRLNEAYEVLGNPIKRREYDATCLPVLPIVVNGLSSGFADSRPLSILDEALLATSIGTTRRQTLSSSIEEILKAGEGVVAAILNRLESRQSKDDYHKYHIRVAMMKIKMMKKGKANLLSYG
jgi:DnaJ-like protein